MRIPRRPAVTSGRHAPARSVRRRAGAALASAALALGTVLVTAGSAAAHVGVTPSETAAGGYSLLTFAVPHGCDGLPTTELRIQVPEELITVTPTVHSNWHIVKMFENLPEPVSDGHGGEYSTRVSELVLHSNKAVEEGFRDEVSIQVTLPETPGVTLYFPVVQICAKSEVAWVQRPEEGQDPEELELPAPSVTITEPEPEPAADGDALAAGEDGAAGGPGAGAGAAPVVVPWLALAAGLAGLALGAAAFVRSRPAVARSAAGPSPSPPDPPAASPSPDPGS